MLTIHTGGSGGGERGHCCKSKWATLRPQRALSASVIPDQTCSFRNLVSRLRDALCCPPCAGSVPLLQHAPEPPPSTPSNRSGGSWLPPGLPCSAGPQPSRAQALYPVQQPSPLRPLGVADRPWPLSRPKSPSGQHDETSQHWRGPNHPKLMAMMQVSALPGVLPKTSEMAGTSTATRCCRGAPRRAMFNSGETIRNHKFVRVDAHIQKSNQVVVHALEEDSLFF